ncbi:MAG: oligosaccharide flippase family protein [Hyphomicrobiaceae bacterium]|nr:oligosaccharide flippase family protein [Hyphomicrobiaceae bacterium]
MTLARNSIANGVAGLATTLAGVLSTIAIARLLGVEGTGIVAFAVWVVTFALLAADLGVPGTLTRYVSSSRALLAEGQQEPGTAPAAVIGYLFWPFLLANGLLVVVLVAYAVHVAVGHPAAAATIDVENYRSSAVFWGLIAAACLTQSMANFTYATLRGLGRFWRLAAIAAVAAAIQVVTTVIGALTLGIVGALLGAVLGYLVPALMAPGFLSPGRAPLAPPLKSRISRYALEAWFGFIVTAFAWSRMEIAFLERSFGSEAVGLYTAGLTLSNVATQGPMLLTGALLPYFASTAARGDRAGAGRAFDTVLRLFTLAVAPACFGLAAITHEVLPLLFGAPFAPASPVAVVLLLASAVTVSASLSTIYLLALERTRFVLAAAGVGAVLVVLSGFLIVPVHGEIGAAVSRAAIQFVVVGAGLWYVVHRLATPLSFDRLALILVAAAATGGAAFVVATSIGGVLGVAAAIAVGLAVYPVAIRLTGALDESDADTIGKALTFLPAAAEGVLAAGLRLLVRRRA